MFVANPDEYFARRISNLWGAYYTQNPEFKDTSASVLVRLTKEERDRARISYFNKVHKRNQRLSNELYNIVS